MATRTSVRSRFTDPLDDALEGRVEYDWSDTTLRILALRGVSPPGFSVPFAIRLTPVADPTVRWTGVYAPGSGTTEQSVPGGVAARFGVFVNATGKLDGVSVETFFPAPPELVSGVEQL